MAFYTETTNQGGSFDYGTVFKIAKDGSGFQTIHHCSLDQGSNPIAGLIEGSGGYLYGVNVNGGTSSTGIGTIFKVAKDGSGFSVIHTFDVGKFPYGGLLEASNGTLYGTTESGGTSSSLNDGILFRLEKDGTGFSILHQFDGFAVTMGNRGGGPLGRLMECSSSGELYGATSRGGDNGQGVVYKIQKDGSGYTVVHSFTGSSGGAEPSGGLFESSDGNLYGLTSNGGVWNGGTAFQLTKDGSYTVFQSFSPGEPGADTIWWSLELLSRRRTSLWRYHCRWCGQ